MTHSHSRISWDTNVKHYIRNGLFDNLPNTIKTQIPKTNRYRWEHEVDNKYVGCEVANFIKEELELINEPENPEMPKKIIAAYFKPSDTYHEIISVVKDIKRLYKKKN